MNPLTFDWKADPVEAEKLLMQLEEIFDMLESTDDQKVMYTAFELVS